MTDDQLLYTIQQVARGTSWRSIAKALGMPWTQVRKEYLDWFHSKLDE